MEKIVITGGSGYLGKELVSRLVDIPETSIHVIARDEGKLIELKQLFPTVNIYTGDINDPFDVRQIMKGAHAVYHLAASKHIGIAEKQVRECIKSNVVGTINILDAAIDKDLCPDMKLVFGVSTDKAALVSGVYGATKLLMERLFKQYESLRPDIAFRVVRYGNVLYSTGSVLCKWKESIQKGEKITITNFNATRFFWTVQQAVDHIFGCIQWAKSSEPFIPEMKAIMIGDLLYAMLSKYLPKTFDRDFYTENNIEIVGLAPGENLHERMSADGLDSSQCERYTESEIFDLI